jgi:hypothetical protein
LKKDLSRKVVPSPVRALVFRSMNLSRLTVLLPAKSCSVVEHVGKTILIRQRPHQKSQVESAFVALDLPLIVK